jgi:hypothetical protein
MIKVFAGKVRKTGFFQKAGFPGNSDRIFGICYKRELAIVRIERDILRKAAAYFAKESLHGM